MRLQENRCLFHNRQKIEVLFKQMQKKTHIVVQWMNIDETSGMVAMDIARNHARGYSGYEL